jgi:hypothetical protein
MKRFLVTAVIACAMILTPAMTFGVVIVDDSWVDAGRNNGADALDTDWWSSTSASANSIEVGSGFLGLVSGTSGRGIHGTFASQALGIGDTLTATFTFTTPATVTANGAGGANFKIGLFDTTGHTLAQDIGTPSNLYTNLNGYMMDFDVNPTTSGTNIQFRQRSNAASQNLLSTTGDYTSLASGGASYSFAANTTYTGVFSLTRTGSDSLDLYGALYQGASLLSSTTVSDVSGIVSNIGMLAFHPNANIFGSSATVGAADNGIDFSNIKIEVVPEPSTLILAFFGLAGLMYASLRRRR